MEWKRFHKNMARKVLAAMLFSLVAVPFATASSAPTDKDKKAEEAKKKAEEEAKKKAEDAKSGKPPGDCTQQQWKELDVAAGKACRGPDTQRSCDGVEDCQILARNVFRFDRCIAARKAVMDKCFRGGDAAHKAELAKEEAGRLKCMEALKLCKIEACPR